MYFYSYSLSPFMFLSPPSLPSFLFFLVSSSSSSATYTFGALEAVAPQPARPNLIPKKKKTSILRN